MEEYVNAGIWNVTDFGFRIGAAHSPAFDDLMTTLRLAERAVQEDEPRVRRLPRPWLGDLHHNRLKNAMNRAKGAAMDYLLSHPDLLIVQRKLG